MLMPTVDQCPMSDCFAPSRLLDCSGSTTTRSASGASEESDPALSKPGPPLGIDDPISRVAAESDLREYDRV
jgi:hypothetical protein